MFLVSVIALENRKQVNAENRTSLKIKVHELRIITHAGLQTHFLDFLTAHHKHQRDDLEKIIYCTLSCILNRLKT